MTDELFSVRDQVVLVSGASRGIGRAIAAGFAQRDAQVIVTGRERATLEQTANDLGHGERTVRPITCDVANADSIAALVESVLGEFGHVDTLVNVAGVNRRKRAEEFTVDDYDFIVDINLKGAFLLSQAVGRAMLARGQGCQVNISSLNNERPLTHVAPYAISKAGLGHMTRALACEWGPRGVRVNAIAPGFILTDLTQKLWSQEKMLKWGLANTPLRRLGQPDDMIGAAIFLASPAAAFLTGQIIYVDGGFTSGWQWPIE
ncbi:MAG TPA: glucose 1-dehydrogenase [Pirellulales bacterium]|nr:glucose 1-dehydrogenase [Pirellulales bacterium]